MLATKKKAPTRKKSATKRKPAAGAMLKVAGSAAKRPAKGPKKPLAKASSAKTALAKAAVEERDEARKLALGVATVGLDHSALNVEIIDVRGKVDYADYVVVMSGRSDRQVSALARHIEAELEKKHGQRCSGIEGLPTASWLLMDYGDVVVHIFHEDTRGYYDLETLWLDAARVPTPPVPGAPARD
jgi:ribosome-associated protein